MKRTNRRTILAAATALLAVGAVATAAIRVDITTPDGFYHRQLVRCDEPGSAEETRTNPVDCFTTIFATAMQNDQSADLIAAIEKTLDERPELYPLCHAAAHKASKTALDSTDDLFELLDTTASNTLCDWGFGHGIMDALALRGEDPGTLDALIDWCTKHEDDDRLYGLCADGIGHYSMISTGDLERSAANCARIAAAPGKDACGGGVLMQLFEPADKAPSVHRRDEAHTVVPALCERWKAAQPAVENQNGCSSGAGYVYGLDGRDAAWAWLRADETTRSPKIPTEPLRHITDTLDANILRCDQLATPRDPCLTMLIQSIPLALGHRHPAEYDALCRRFPHPGGTAKCMERRAQQYR